MYSYWNSDGAYEADKILGWQLDQRIWYEVGINKEEDYLWRKLYGSSDKDIELAKILNTIGKSFWWI